MRSLSKVPDEHGIEKLEMEVSITSEMTSLNNQTIIHVLLDLTHMLTFFIDTRLFTFTSHAALTYGLEYQTEDVVSKRFDPRLRAKTEMRRHAESNLFLYHVFGNEANVRRDTIK